MDVYLFIQTEPGMATTVMNALVESKAVTRAASITGQYDVFARIDNVDFGDLTERLVNRVQRTPGVKRTVTAAGLPANVAVSYVWPVPTMPLRFEARGPQALVFAHLQAGAGAAAIERLAASKAVHTLAILTGEYDVVMQVSGPSIEAIARKVLRDIQSIPGVKSTTTSLVAAVTALPGRPRRKPRKKTTVKRTVKGARKTRRPKR